MRIALSAGTKRLLTWVLAQRRRLPRGVNRLIDDVAKNPDGAASRIVARLMGGGSRRRVPPATEAPSTPVRVYIGPTNYAGQGARWARALETSAQTIGARNMAIELPGGFAFEADSVVPIAVHTISTTWQRAELAAVKQFTHVLFEAERSLFGPLLGRSVSREIAELEADGVSCAFLCHGTDIRSPRRHMSRDPLSPYFDDPQTELLQRDADFNRSLIDAHPLPVFVSTPDLLIDVPHAEWCPVVVEPGLWTGGRELGSALLPVVAHLPSMGAVKGTHLVEPVVQQMHRAGILEYRGMTGIASEFMPQVIGDADIVLDQFRIGSYGVAAVEAMAAGRVVVGHVLPDVRALVFERTGLELPVVEAVPSSLRQVLEGLVSDPARMKRIATQGQHFVHEVHSGPRSADVLVRTWISAA